MQLVLVCGGSGTRLGALNPGRIPKAMFPIHGVPLVEHLWRRFGPLSDAPPILVYAATDPSAPAWARARLPRAILCPQERPDGVANALALARPLLDGPALFLLGDVVLEGAFPKAFPGAPAVAIWRAGPPEATRANFGVELDGDHIVELVEKPPVTNGLVCGLGAYLLAPGHLGLFASAPVNPHTGEREITEALRHLVRGGYCLQSLAFEGRYLNVNAPGDVGLAEALLQ